MPEQNALQLTMRNPVGASAEYVHYLEKRIALLEDAVIAMLRNIDCEPAANDLLYKIHLLSRE